MTISLDTSNTMHSFLQSQENIGTSLKRLSTLIRVNSAADDPAALYSIAKQTADIRGMDQSMRNAGDGISMTQIADGSLSQIQENMQRIRELSVQAANGTVEGREVLQMEVDQLTQEISRIAQNTSFNGKELFPAAGDQVNFHIGADGKQANQVSVDLETLDGINAYDAALNATKTIDITSEESARAALSQLDDDIDQITGQRSSFGASQSRFAAAISNIQDSFINLTESRSRIQDADIAAETANLAKARILEQTELAQASHANDSAQSALSLLR